MTATATDPWRPARFARAAAVTNLVAGLLVAIGAAGFGLRAVAFGLLGWALLAVVGTVGGAWLVSAHGQTGSTFLIAMAVCMLSRLFFGGAGALAAGSQGFDAMIPYIGGLAAGYIPVQVLEMIWFHRRTYPMSLPSHRELSR